MDTSSEDEGMVGAEAAKANAQADGQPAYDAEVQDEAPPAEPDQSSNNVEQPPRRAGGEWERFFFRHTKHMTKRFFMHSVLEMNATTLVVNVSTLLTALSLEIRYSCSKEQGSAVHDGDVISTQPSDEFKISMPPQYRRVA